MNTRRFYSVTLAIILLLTACRKPVTDLNSTARSPKTQPELPFAQELQDVLESGLEKYGGMGLSAAVIAPGYEMWSGASGVSFGNSPITPDTLFSAGSINKMYTAVTILQLAEEGMLDLDDPLHEWLPDYPHVDGTITIRQLLNHTGGVFDMVRHPDYWDAMLADPAKVWAPEEIITHFLLEPYFPKGTGWHYSTPGYILLRMIVKKATGSELSTTYRDRLFKPLALENTYLAGEEDLPENTAHGWLDIDGDGSYDDLASYISFNSGIGGAVYASAKDLALWSQALFSQGRLLGKASFKQMLAFHSPTPGEPLLVGYGLGVVKFSPELFNGLEIWGHSGNAPGYAAACFYLPEFDTSISMMTNTHQEEPMWTINDLLTIVTSGL